MRTFVLNEIVINQNGRVEYDYTIPYCVRKFISSRKFFVEYSDDIALKNVPEAILTVPFIANMLTIAMITGCSIKVKKCDKAFFEAIKEIEDVYRKMYPYLKLTFDVAADEVVDCSYEISESKTLFFTGGLDATSALARVYEKDVTLVNIWGGDVALSDKETHDDLSKYLSQIKKFLGLKYLFIKSNCREMFNEKNISKLTAIKLRPKHNHGWWASIAHVLAMVSLLAPYAYDKRIGINMLASSYTRNGTVFDANNEEMLAAIKFGSCKMVSIDSNLQRTDKAKNIIRFSKEHNFPVQLKVCWFRKAGKNCSSCEKCYRTILDIVVSGGNPNDFGFKVDDNTYLEMQKYLLRNYVNPEYWKEIQERFIEEKNTWQDNENIGWIINFRFNRPEAIMRKAVSVAQKFIHF